MWKVLVPMDGSRSAMRALAYVLGQAGREGMSVQLIYVHFIPPFYENPGAYLRRDENRRVADKCAKAALAPAVRRLTRAGIQHRTIMKLGDAAPEIVRAAAQMNCESIVMGSRGLGAIKSLVVGSTATKVIRLATIPVTIVNFRTKAARGGVMPVLAAVDGSSCSLRALARAIAIAEATRCVVHLINVQPSYDEYGMVPAYLSKAKHRDLMRARARAALAPAIARLRRAQLPHVAHTAYGDTADAIVRAARRLRCGSIVMGTRGMGAIGNLLIGSTANSVIHIGTTPVTLVK